MMLQEIRIACWRLEVDIDNTQAYYNKDIDICDCLYCNNFVEVCKYLDPSVRNLFSKLGIDPTKPGHLSDYPTKQDGILEYIGSYHLVGRVIEGEMSTSANWDHTNTVKIKNFIIGFSDDLEFVPEGFSNPILQLDFDASIPWVLDEI